MTGGVVGTKCPAVNPGVGTVFRRNSCHGHLAKQTPAPKGVQGSGLRSEGTPAPVEAESQHCHFSPSAPGRGWMLCSALLSRGRHWTAAPVARRWRSWAVGPHWSTPILWVAARWPLPCRHIPVLETLKEHFPPPRPEWPWRGPQGWGSCQVRCRQWAVTCKGQVSAGSPQCHCLL